MKKKINPTLLELLAGILFYGILAEIAGLLIVQNKVMFSTGLWIGCLTAVFMAVHMTVSMERALDLDAKAAGAYIHKTFAVRTAVVFLVLGLTVYFQVGDVISCFLGVMALKVAAYIQPVTHKIIHGLKR